MAKNNSEHINSEDILLWARRIEAQRAQAATLNDITEAQKFDKVKLVQNPRVGKRQKQQDIHIKGIHASTVGKSHIKSLSSIWENMYWLWENWSLPKGVHEQKEPCSP